MNIKTENCLNIGCGLVIAEGWQNIDTSPSLKIAKTPFFGSSLVSVFHLPPWSEKAQYGNIVKGLKIAANSCDLVYTSHVLEHLSIIDFNIALTHIYTYLKPGGIFRAIVPDLEILMKTYFQELQDENLAPQASFNLMQNSLLGHLGTRRTLFHRLREAFSNNRHQWMWDKISLGKALRDHGFKDVHLCQYGEWGDPRFMEVEHYESFASAICLEGVK